MDEGDIHLEVQEKEETDNIFSVKKSMFNLKFIFSTIFILICLIIVILMLTDHSLHVDDDHGEESEDSGSTSR